MPDVSEIVTELESYGVPNATAHLIVARLIVIGAEAAVFRKETITALADVEVERRNKRIQIVRGTT